MSGVDVPRSCSHSCMGFCLRMLAALHLLGVRHIINLSECIRRWPRSYFERFIHNSILITTRVQLTSEVPFEFTVITPRAFVLDNNVMEPSTSLKQPWKEWFKVEKNLNVRPLENPVNLGRARQGSLPQKPRNVDLSAEKTKASK